jgi:Tol biopolymer transport system component
MAYHVSGSSESLWRSQSTSTETFRLIGAEEESAFPVWSPDGLSIAVVARKPNETWKLNVITAATGRRERWEGFPRNVLHPSWSADGRKILFGTIPSLERTVRDSSLYVIDWMTKSLATVPGSEGMFTPSWSPDGKHIAALDGESYNLMIQSSEDGQWRRVTADKAGYPVWSADSKRLYFLQVTPDAQVLARVEVGTWKITKRPLKAPRILDRWAGMDPNGALLFARDLSFQEIYAVDLRP